MVQSEESRVGVVVGETRDVEVLWAFSFLDCFMGSCIVKRREWDGPSQVSPVSIGWGAIRILVQAPEFMQLANRCKWNRISPETLDRRSDKPAVAKKTVGWAKINQILLLPTQISPSPHMLFRPFRPLFGLRGL